MTITTNLKNIGILLRISREAGEGRDTLQSHRTIAERYCNEHGYQYKIYEEIISGGKEIIERAELTKLLNDVTEGLLDAVFVVSTDRISRKLGISTEIADTLADYEIPILTPERSYDLNSNDRFMFDIEGVMGSHELRVITKRYRRGKREGSLRGEWIQGVPPFGYRRCEDITSKNYKHLEIYEEEAKLVRMIFNYALNGYGIPSIVDKMAGFKTRSYLTSSGKWHEGKSFGISHVNTILKNRVYTGELTYNIKDKRKRVKETIIKPDAHEPIIPLSQFNTVQSAIKGRLSGDMEKRNRSKGECISILKDLLYCDICGLKMRIRRDSKRKDKIHVNKCKCGNKGIAEERIVTEIWGKLSSLEKQLRESFQKAIEKPTDDSKEFLIESIDKLSQKEQKLKDRLKNMRNDYYDRVVSKEEYLSDKAEVDKELTSINTSKGELSRKLKQFDTETISSEYKTKLKWLDDLRKLSDIYNNRKLFIMGKDLKNAPTPSIDKIDIEEVNRLLKLIIDKIHYRRYNEETTLFEDGFVDIEKGDFIKVTVSPK